MEITQEAWDDLMDQWHMANRDGEGYGIGEENSAPEEAVLAEGWEVIARHVERTVLARKLDGTYVVVCDSGGPWCVDVEDDGE